jgi:hypothetical protein
MKWKILALGLVGASAFANELREMPFDEKVSKAAVVLIGTVERLQARTSHPEWAQVKVESVLKGAASTSIRVRSRGMIAETYVPMAVGCRYFFLLYEKREGMYGSVNGRFAVIPIDKGCPAD